jgi:ornithine cyclodeaminase/alanine dehydrogenase-like protein (mu-crystallin family)
VSGVPTGGSRGGPREIYVPDRPSFLYLGRTDLDSLGIGMDEIVDAVDAACRIKGEGHADMPPKLNLHGPGGSFSQVMAASLGAQGLGVKWVTIFPANVAAGLPLVNGLIVLSDPVTGRVSAAIEAGVVTAWRTGASAAVAARYLARRDVDCVGLLGCGVQGTSSVMALAAVLPELRSMRCFDAVPAASEAFVRGMRKSLPDISVTVCDAAQEVPRGAGVVVSAITMVAGVRPPLEAGLLEPGALAVALDYDAAWTGEAMADCDRLYCDDMAQVLAAKAAGPRLSGIPAEIAGDLGDLAVGRVPGRITDTERLFSLNLGMAVEDVATAQLAFDRARELGVGRDLPI